MATVVHFDVPADLPERAKKFYAALFGWRFISPPGHAGYSLVETSDTEGRPGIGGGLGMRGDPSQEITIYFGVFSVREHAETVVREGGTIVVPYTEVPGFGALAICRDTEGNRFGLWEDLR